MTAALIIILVLLALLLILAFQRVGVVVEYDEDGLRLWLKLSTWTIQVLPVKVRKKKKAKKEPEPSERFTAEKIGGTFELLKKLLPVIVDAAGDIKEKIYIEEFFMDVMWRAPDPLKCALGYGAANAAVGMIWPLIEQNFRVETRQIRTFLDFKPGTPSIADLEVKMTMLVWHLVVWSVRLAVRLSSIYRDFKKQQETKSIT